MRTVRLSWRTYRSENFDWKRRADNLLNCLSYLLGVQFVLMILIERLMSAFDATPLSINALGGTALLISSFCIVGAVIACCQVWRLDNRSLSVD